MITDWNMTYFKTNNTSEVACNAALKTESLTSLGCFVYVVFNIFMNLLGFAPCLNKILRVINHNIPRVIFLFFFAFGEDKFDRLRSDCDNMASFCVACRNSVAESAHCRKAAINS